MSKKTSLILWLLKIFRGMFSLIIKLPLRLVACAAGIVLMAGGILLTVTIVGAPVGIPLAVLGFLLVVRSIF